jgi:chemotaxis signal transduction protein
MEEYPNAGATEDATRELLLLRAGGRLFAVLAGETDGVAEGLTPAPLPHAPRAVLGVVCLRGRMLTVLDPAALVAAHEEAGGESADRGTPRLFVALRGDEQLALAADGDEGVIEINADSLAPPEHPDPTLRGTVNHDGARVPVLDPSRLFDAAFRGTERRRQRS